MIIGFDVDDVLIDTNPYLLRHLNKKFGTKIRNEDITTYLMEGLFGKDKDVKEEIYRFIAEKGEDLPAMKGAREAIDELSQRDKIIAITARQEVDELTRRCLSREFNGRIEEVYFGGLSGKTRKSKAEIVRERNADLFVDDRLEYALECSLVIPNVFLFGDYRWNDRIDLPLNVKRTIDWRATLEEIERIRSESIK